MPGLFNVTIACDEIDSVSNPQFVTIPLDLNISGGGQIAFGWGEGFESGTLGQFSVQNLDIGIPGNNNVEGVQNGDDTVFITEENAGTVVAP